MPLAPLLLRRATALWVLARLVVCAVMLASGEPPPPGFPLSLGPGGLLMVPFAVLLGLVDVQRRGERALLGNLGVSAGQLALWLALPAAVGEIGLAAAAGARPR